MSQQHQRLMYVGETKLQFAQREAVLASLRSETATDDIAYL